MTVAPLAAIVSSYSLLAIPVALLVQRPARLDLTFRLLLLYSITSFTVEYITGVIDATSPATRVLSFAFTIFEYTVFTLFFYRFFLRKSFRRWVIGGSLIFGITVILELNKFGVVYYSRFNAGAAAILIISYSLLLFHEWLVDDPMEYLYKKAAFWIALGCLLYLAGNFFFFITVGKRWEQNQIIHAVFNLLKNGLFVIAILQAFPVSRPKKTF